MIDRFYKELLYLLEKGQVLIVVAQTGSGKSTLIPQILFRAGIYNKKSDELSNQPGLKNIFKHKLIGITEPRRVAVTQLAARVAASLKCDLGTTVGFAVRFKDVTNFDHTQIKYMTEGLLIREMMQDPLLLKYSVIMLDEAHERNLSTDLLLGLLKCITLKRHDLKLIISSATLDIDVFLNFFNSPSTSNKNNLKTNVLSSECRTFPLKVFYKKQPVSNYLDAAVEAVRNIHETSRLDSGKILIFLTGQDEVDYVCERLNDYAFLVSSRHDLKRLLILPLYASLKAEEISKVFDEHGRHTRVCIVSTNVAETSLTIDNVAYVIDCGFVKLKVYDHKTGIDKLMRIAISKSAARQRAGRAARTRNGTVFRLYTESHFEKLLDSTIPEVQRSSLSETIMLLKSLGVDNILKFPLISTMPRSNLVDSLNILYSLQAIDDSGRLTKMGETMAQFNLDPKISKILVSPRSIGCTQDVCRLAGMLQVKDIYQKPSRHTASSLWSNENLLKLCVSEGDIPTYLNIINEFIRNKKSQRWAERRFLNYEALLNALEVSTKLEVQLRKMGLSITSACGRAELIQKATLSGLFANAAYLHPSGSYRTIRGEQVVHMHPTSVFAELVEDRPKFVVFNDVLYTSKPFMRHVMCVERDWLLEAAPHHYKFGTELSCPS